MQFAQFVRLDTDVDGESHFEDLEIGLSPTDFAPPVNIAQFLPTTSSLWVSMLTEWAGEEPHPAPNRQIFCVVQGECQVIASDSTSRNFQTESGLVMEDTWGKGHSTQVLGEKDLLIFGVR
jgi:hypothetical protein